MTTYAISQPVRIRVDSAFDEKSLGRFFRIFGVLLVLAVLGLLFVMKENWNSRLAKQMISLEVQEKELTIQESYLIRDLEWLARDSRIERLARKNLAMEYPRKSVVMIWSGSQVNAAEFGSKALCKKSD